LAFPIEQRVYKEYKEEKKKGLVKHLRKINRTFAYWSVKGILIGMFIKRMIKRALAVFDKQVQSNTKDRSTRKIQPRKEKTTQTVPHELQRFVSPGILNSASVE
jgi:hypothetical protein